MIRKLIFPFLITLLFFSTSLFGGIVEKSSGDLSMSIPDYSYYGVSHSLDLTETGNVSSVDVAVDITHPWRGDIKIVLTCPDGQSVVLREPANDSGNDIVETYTVAECNNQPAAGEWKLTVSDHGFWDWGTLNNWTLRVTVEDDNQNHAPVADAGDDITVDEGTLVSLDGSGSYDPDNDEITYRWRQLEGPVVDMDSFTQNPVFTAPDVAEQTTLKFHLIVNDGELDSEPVYVYVTVNHKNLAPIANAGLEQTVFAGTRVTLDGSRSRDPEGAPITFRWSQTAGSGVFLNDSNAVSPTFLTPPVTETVTLTFELIVNDGELDSAPATVNIIVKPSEGNRPPVANAGVDFKHPASPKVTLDGSASSDPDGDPITYSWRKVSDVNVALNNSTYETPSFDATRITEVTTITFELIVNDGNLDSEPDTVTVTIVPDQNTPPVADAGRDKIVFSGDDITLDASGSSDYDGDPLSFSWQQTGGYPKGIIEGNIGINSESLTFKAPHVAALETFTFEVTVSDGEAHSTDTVQVIVKPISFLLEMSSSDTPLDIPDNDENGIESVINLKDNNSKIKKLDVTVDITHTYIGDLEVVFTCPDGRTEVILHAKGEGGSADDIRKSFSVTECNDMIAGGPWSLKVRDTESQDVGTLNSWSFKAETEIDVQKPVAVIGTATPEVNGGDKVKLDGGRSYDPTGQYGIEKYNWRQVSGPTVYLGQNYETTFRAPHTRDRIEMEFELVVSNPTGDSDPVYQTIVVNPSITEEYDFDSADTPLAIPDNNSGGVTSANAMDIIGMLMKAEITVDITHPNAGDLKIEYKCPTDNVNWHVLRERSGEGTANINEKYTITECPITNIPGPGTWTLRVSDLNAGNAGTLNTWNVRTFLVDVNHHPVPHAGDDQSVAAGSTVQLDGSLTYDPDAQYIEYEWTQTAGPDVTINEKNSVIATFEAPEVSEPTVLSFELTTRQHPYEKRAAVNITVNPVPESCGDDVCQDNEGVHNCLADCSRDIVLIVDGNMEAELQSEIDQYISNTAALGKKVYALAWNSGTAAELKNLLKSEYENYRIKGAWFVGDIPTAWFEQPGWYSNIEEFPCDIFFSDINGMWLDKDGNGKYDWKTTTILDIFTSRITGTAADIKTYFAKLHDYYTAGSLVNQGSFVFIDDDWDYQGTRDYGFGGIYRDEYKLYEKSDTTFDNYVGRLSSIGVGDNPVPGPGAEFVHHKIHASPYNFMIAHDSETYPDGNGGGVSPEVIAEHNFQASFYTLASCSPARFTHPSITVAEALIQSTEYGLAVFGSTKVCNLNGIENFHIKMGEAENNSFGDAYRYWYNKNGRFSDLLHLGYIILGDPLLTIQGDASETVKTLAGAGHGAELSEEERKAREEAEMEIIRRHAKEIEKNHDTFEQYRKNHPEFFRK